MLLPLFHVSAQLKQPAVPPAIDSLHWLIGHWERISMKEGSTGYEQWQKGGANELTGRGVTMEDGDTVLVEKIRLVEKNNLIYYVADVPENNKSVYFRLTSMDANSFTCINPEHDFPKKIVYIKKGNQLVVTISDEKRAIDYLFVKR
jgi:hypothetical protein